MKQNMILAFIISLSFFSLINAEGFGPETLVKTSDKSIAIHELVKDQTLLSYDFTSAKIVQSHICFAHQKHVDEYYKIKINNESIMCASDQKFFCVNHNAWICADQLIIGDALLCHSGSVVINAIELIREPKDLYIIGLSPPHTFFVGRHEICAHNIVIETVCSISYVMSSSGGAALIASAAINIAGFVIASLFVSRSKKRDQSYKETDIQVSASFGSPDPNDPKDRRSGIIKVNNMHEFFETEFGREIRPHLEKTKKSNQGQSVYKVTKDVPKYGLKKGDQLYLDALHKDHLEVFDKCGKSQSVLNLDGTINTAKMDAAELRRI